MHPMTSNRHHNLFIDNAVCFWTSSIVEKIPVFRSATARREMVRIWEGCRARCGVKILGYVIMLDHVHIAVWAESAADVKRFLRQSLSIASSAIAGMTERAAARGDATAAEWLSAFQMRARGKARVRVWKERGRAFPLTRLDGLRQKLDYMHANPVKLGLAQTPEEWEFSSARWYCDGKGPLRIDDIVL